MKKLTKVTKDVPERRIHDMTAVFFVEVSSNLYYVRKHRADTCRGKYVDGTYVAKELNTGFNVALLKENGDLLSNFSSEPYREFLVNSLNREVL